MKPVIKTEALTKYYKRVCGVEGLDLKVMPGEIFGFLGPNGAGKTTTIRLLMHTLLPTAGEIRIFGKSLSENYPEILKKIGYLPSDDHLYPHWNGKQLLQFAGAFYKKRVSKQRTAELVERLGCNLNSPVNKLSKGNKQKIGILLALFHKPELLILDEPTSGLDPLSQQELYSLLADLKNEGVTIFFSSHNLPEVEKVCDRAGIIRSGTLIDVQTVQDLRHKRHKNVTAVFAEDYSLADFQNIQGVKILQSKPRSIQLLVKSAAMGQLIKALHSYEVIDLNAAYPDLEDVFLKYYKADTA